MLAWLAIAAQLQVAGPPVTTIGAVDGDSISALHHVAGLEEDRRGNVDVIQRGTPYVLVFDRTGRSVAVLGRQGGGPGEFSVPTRVFHVADTTWVVDAALGKLVVFDQEFRHVRDHIIAREHPVVHGRRAVPLGLSSEGIVVEALSELPDRSGLLVSHLLLPWGGAEPVELHSFPHSDRIRQTMFMNRNVSLVVPLPVYPTVVTGPGGAYEITRDDALRLRKVGSSQAVTVALSPLEVPTAMWDSIIDGFVETLTFANTSASRGSLQRNLHELFPKPERRLFVSNAFTGARPNTLWIRREPPGGSRTYYEVSVETGDVLRSLATEKSVMALGEDYVWVLETDADDVPFLVKYALREG